MFLSGEVRELHHDGRTNGKDLVDMLLFYELLDTNSYYTFLAVATVISHDDDFVRTFAYLILKDNQVLRTTRHY